MQTGKRPELLGARGEGDPAYRGEQWIDGEGTVERVAWSPRRVRLRVRGAKPGTLVVLNQNWDPGWSANGEPAIDHAHALAYRVRSSDEVVELRYWPRLLTLALMVGAIGLGASMILWRARKLPTRKRLGTLDPHPPHE
jgi:hypothetical protein